MPAAGGSDSLCARQQLYRFSKLYLDRLLAPWGLNSSQHMFLTKICRQPGVSQDSLIATSYVHPSNIVRTVAALEKKGLLTRTPSEEDKRTCRLYPTDQARSVVTWVEQACAQTEQALLQGFTEEEKAAFLSGLMRMGKNITTLQQIHRKEDENDV